MPQYQNKPVTITAGPLVPGAGLAFGNGDFGAALNHLKAGGKVARAGSNVWLRLEVPVLVTQPNHPFILARTVLGEFVRWQPSHADMLANDWSSVPADAA